MAGHFMEFSRVNIMILICKVCKTVFKTSHKDTKYCSRKCFAKSKKGVKPVYSFTSETAKIYGFKKGNRWGFKKGYTPWNYKGDNVGYRAIHAWVGRRLGKASQCSINPKHTGRFVWANKSGNYERDLSDWHMLCQSCNFNDGVKIHSRFKK